MGINKSFSKATIFPPYSLNFEGKCFCRFQKIKGRQDKIHIIASTVFLYRHVHKTVVLFPFSFFIDKDLKKDVKKEVSVFLDDDNLFKHPFSTH